MISETIPDYEILSFRGQGAFGHVLEAYDRINDHRVSIKRSHKASSKLSREYSVLSKINDCVYVNKLLDLFYTVDDSGKIIQNLVFEYVSRNLEKFIQEYREKKQYIPIEKIRSLSKQLLIGLDYCHKKNVVHRDLKPENILLTKDDVVKICDFGSSKIIDGNTKNTPYIVSRYYRPPELMFGSNEYDSKIDIFSAGCIIAELFTLSPLFKGQLEGLQIYEYLCILGNPGKEYFEQYNIDKKTLECLSKFDVKEKNRFEMIINKNKVYKDKDIKHATDLIYQMLNWEPKNRLSAEECLKHPFFIE